MTRILTTLLAALSFYYVNCQNCPSYATYSRQRDVPHSPGAYALQYMRPPLQCRTFTSPAVETTIRRLKRRIYDPDLAQLFENTFPNTLDTAIRWRGSAVNNSEEELCFIVTGDIDAMWIRDSANQVSPYKTVLNDKDDEIATIFRGTINLQSRYLIKYPYCNAFHPPEESGIGGFTGGTNKIRPQIDPSVVFTCNFELDDFGGFLQLSYDYFNKTEDLGFFGNFQWIYAVQSIVSVCKAMRQPTYGPTGEWIPPPYTYNSLTYIASGTQGPHGFNNPVNYTGMVRSPFRPSDDAAIFDFGIAANMMLSRYLEVTATSIMANLPNAPEGLAQELLDIAQEIKAGIEQYGVVPSPKTGQTMYAYEVDGYGGRNLMDDANVPSLLSAPYLGYVDANDSVYLRTREYVLSKSNPWWSEGSVISAVGSPHIGPNQAWPMANIMRAMTTDNYWEIYESIKEVLASTDGLGLIHESVNSNDASNWSRQWFVWANALFGQLIIELSVHKPDMLRESFQPLRI